MNTNHLSSLPQASTLHRSSYNTDPCLSPSYAWLSPLTAFFHLDAYPFPTTLTVPGLSLIHLEWTRSSEFYFESI